LLYDTGFPIDEVIESISTEQSSNNYQGGFASYWRMARAAKDGSLPQEDTTDFENLRNACAEAMIYKLVRESPATGDAPVTTTAVFDPIGKASSLKALLPDFAKPFTNKIIESARGKTPDLLQVSAPFSYRDPDGALTTQSPGLRNIVDPNDPTASRTKIEPYPFKTLIAPMEITLSANADNMLAKVKKAKSYSNPFGKSGSVEFVPVVVLDRKAFLSRSLEDRVKIVQKMKEAGGYIQLISNLKDNAAVYAKLISLELVQAVQSAQRAKPKELDSKEQQSLSSKLFKKPQEWFQKLTQKLSSNNKNTQATNNVEKSIKKESASEIYQRIASKAKSNASFFQKGGLDVVNNSNHLDLAIASYTVYTNLDTIEILKQSPTYLSKRPAVAKMWLDKIVEDGAKMAGEENFNTPQSQKIIQAYDKEKTKANSQIISQSEQQKYVDAFDQVTALVKDHSSEFSRNGLNVLENRQHLLIAIGAVLIEADKDPKQILRQSPEYLSTTPEVGETLLNGLVEKAETALLQASPDKTVEKNNSQNRGYER
jgi:hypothetical protein